MKNLNLVPPAAASQPTSRMVHATPLRDDYAWLKADNWREVLQDPLALPAGIREYLVAENDYASGVLASVVDMQDAIVAEMRGRLKEDDSTVPSPDGPYSYLTRYREGEQHPVYARIDRASGVETVLLDGAAMASGKPFFELGSRRHSDDHRLLAWSCDETGSEFFTIRVRDTASLQDMPDVITATSGDVVWDTSGQSFLYVRLDAQHRPNRVYRHVLGTPTDHDTLVYEESDEGWFVALEESQSGRFCFLGISDHETSEVWLLERDDLAAPPRLVEPRLPKQRYSLDHHGDTFIILTNADGATDFKVVVAPVDAPGRENWRDLVGSRPGIMVLDVVTFRDWWVRLEREDAKPRLVVRGWSNGAEHAIVFPDEAYALRRLDGFEYATPTLRFAYSSMTTPAETYDYDMASRQRVLLKRQDIPSGHDPARYVTRRLFATSPDGQQVPISVLHRRDSPLDGSPPCLLYGYGAYGHALSAGFDSRVLSLVDRGFVYAIAHVRGGTEKGWAWYTDGKLDRKTNSFIDFIACAQALCEQGYTHSGGIVAQGRSAGGMLMGAVTNMAPELFAAVIAEVPFVDVLATMLDGSLPLTPPEWPEWGNPGVSAEDFERIRSYSPVDQVTAQAYPAILAIGGLTDPRVTYWEPAKWVARLRAMMTGGGPVVLQIDMDSGHGGASGRFDRLTEVAQSYAFAVGAVSGRLEPFRQPVRSAAASAAEGDVAGDGAPRPISPVSMK